MRAASSSRAGRCVLAPPCNPYTRGLIGSVPSHGHAARLTKIPAWASLAHLPPVAPRAALFARDQAAT